MPKLDTACLRDFREVWSTNQDRPFIWKSHWKQLGWAHKLVGQANILWASWQKLRGGTHLLALWEDASEEEQWPLPTLLSGRKLPLQLSLWHQTLRFLPVCPWCLLGCCPSAGTQREWVWVSPFPGPLRGTTWDSRSSLSLSVTFPAGFYGQKLWRLLFLALELWAWGPGVGLGPLALLLRGHLCSWDIPLIFTCGTL